MIPGAQYAPMISGAPMGSFPVMSYGYPVTSGSAAPVSYSMQPATSVSAAPVQSYGMAIGSLQPVVYSQTFPVPVQTTQTVMENQVSSQP
eukprot:751892-Hanusia_phi.AAC.1